MDTHAPTLYQAIAALLEQNGRGVVDAGVDRIPHTLPAMTDGWRALQRGLPQSFIDLETAAPLTASGSWLGYQLRPMLVPLALRAEPLPLPIKAALTAGAAAFVMFTVSKLGRRGRGYEGAPSSPRSRQFSVGANGSR